MIPLPSEQSILFLTVLPVQKKRRISYDDDDTDTDSDNNTDTATASPRRVLFQQSPLRLPRRRPVLVTLRRLLFQESAPHLARRRLVLVSAVAATATVATEESTPRPSVSSHTPGQCLRSDGGCLSTGGRNGSDAAQAQPQQPTIDWNGGNNNHVLGSNAVCDHEYNREENAKKMKKDFRQSTPQEILAWKKKNASSTTTHLSKAPQTVQDSWEKIKQICDDCLSNKLDVWVDRTYLYYY